jgi:hypothetical protein
MRVYLLAAITGVILTISCGVVFAEDGARVLPAVGRSSCQDFHPNVDLRLVEGSVSAYWFGPMYTEIHGEIHNQGASPVTDVTVDVAVYNSAGELDRVLPGRVSHTSVCASEVDVLGDSCTRAGESLWFSALVLSSDPSIDRVVVFMDGRDTTLIPVTPSLELVGDLGIEGGMYTGVGGTVKNTGTVPLVGISVMAVARDAAGLLVITQDSFVREGGRIGGYGYALQPGESAHFRTGGNVYEEDIDLETCEIFPKGYEYRGGDFKYAVAGIAHREGVHGAQWSSDLSATNHSGANGLMRLRLFHQSGVAEQWVEIADGESMNWHDVVVTLFGLTDQVAGFVRIDSTVPLSVSGRTANLASGGSYGQLMPAVKQETMRTQSGVLAPIRGGQAFRTNIGFMNPFDRTCWVSVVLFDGNGEQSVDLGGIEIGADSWLQLNDVAPLGFEVGYAIVSNISSSCGTLSYASIIDEVTGDPMTVTFEPETTLYPAVMPRFVPPPLPNSPWSD